jgi:putative hydrolase of HD superfamily
MALAAIEGADVGRTSALCLLHDAHETRIGDFPPVGRAYVTTASREAISTHKIASLPDAAAKAFQELTVEIESDRPTKRMLPATPTSSKPSSKPSNTN